MAQSLRDREHGSDNSERPSRSCRSNILLATSDTASIDSYPKVPPSTHRDSRLSSKPSSTVNNSVDSAIAREASTPAVFTPLDPLPGPRKHPGKTRRSKDRKGKGKAVDVSSNNHRHRAASITSALSSKIIYSEMDVFSDFPIKAKTDRQKSAKELSRSGSGAIADEISFLSGPPEYRSTATSHDAPNPQLETEIQRALKDGVITLRKHAELMSLYDSLQHKFDEAREVGNLKPRSDRKSFHNFAPPIDRRFAEHHPQSNSMGMMGRGPGYNLPPHV